MFRTVLGQAGSLSRPRRVAGRATRRPRSFSQALEPLEDRSLLSVYVYPSSDVPAIEGTAFNGTIAEFYDPDGSTNANDFQVSIDWKDTVAPDISPGKAVPEMNYPGRFSVTATHSFPSNREGDLYFADVTVTKLSDRSSDDDWSTVLYQDAPLTASFSPINATAGVPTGNVVVATFSDADPGAWAGYFGATINWGDNTGLSAGAIGTTSGTSKFTVTGNHTYATAGTYTVSVQINDVSSTAKASSSVTVKSGQPGISIGDVSVKEGDSGSTDATFTVTLSAPSSQPVSVQWATADGTATAADKDYQAASGTLSFAPNQTSRTITVPVNGDTKFESDEYFVVNLSEPSSNAIIARRQGRGTVLDDDNPPTLTIDDLSLSEGSGGKTNFTFTVTKTGLTSLTASVHWATADGTATVADNDYQVTSGDLAFAPDETSKTITVSVISDPRREPDETFFIDLSAPGFVVIDKTRGTATIVNDDLSDLISDATAGDGARYELYSDRSLWRFSPADVTWSRISGGIISFSLYQDGRIYTLNPAHELWRYDPATNGWAEISGGVVSIDIAGNGDLIALRSDGTLDEFTHTASGSFDVSIYHKLDSGVASFTIGGDGDVIVQEANGLRKKFLRTSSGQFDPDIYILL